jgi:hypothetical protein
MDQRRPHPTPRPRSGDDSLPEEAIYGRDSHAARQPEAAFRLAYAGNKWIKPIGSKKRRSKSMRMNSIITLVGAALIVFGIVTFAYRGMSPLLIGLVLMGGAVLVGVGSTKSS